MIKYLKTYTGGHPFRIEDVEHLQDNTQELINHLVESMAGTGNRILYGVEQTISGGNVTAVSEGVVFANGQILYIPAQSSISIPVAKFCFKKTNVNSATTVEYKDGSFKNVHQIWHGIVDNTDTVTGTVNIDYFVYSNLNSNRKKITLDTSGTNWQAPGGGTPYVVKTGDLVSFDAYLVPVVLPISAGQQKIGTITDANMRPSTDIMKTTSLISGISGTFSIIEQLVVFVYTNGEIWINGCPNNANVIIPLSDIIFTSY